MLENTPGYVGSQGLRAHNRIEHQLKKNEFNLKKDLYMIFRYRSSEFIPLWQKFISDSSHNDLMKIWFINAVTQIEEPQNLYVISLYLHSKNDIIRECAANSYGFLAGPDSIPMLQNRLENEHNGYVKETLKASINAIKRGGYINPISYLPQYYQSKPKKLKFFYNKDVAYLDKYVYSKTDTILQCYNSSPFLIFPVQQFYNRVKYAPKAGTFANNHGFISHVGYDGAWFFEGVPVHSISNGVVKKISHDISWGTLVAIESSLPNNDTITIIYGHLSRFLSITVGEQVYIGQKIGQIGNSVSYENGGYWAHVHLGIIRKPFNRAQLVGYDSDISIYYDPIKLIISFEPDRENN
jgi:murein DD-endopeptidase MepM/ murein hydrolase activator NlpD